MGCAASTHNANVVVPAQNPGTILHNKNSDAVSDCDANMRAGMSQPEVKIKEDTVTPGQNDVVSFVTDEERSKNNTPAVQVHGQAQGLGATSPNTSADKELLELGASSPRSAPEEAPLLPSMLEPLPTPQDVDSIVLPSGDSSCVPHWEKDPLPARPGTSSRRPQSSAGKLVVYKTEKTKKMEAEAKKKRGDELGASPEKEKTPSRRASALPPIKLRKKVTGLGDSGFEVMTPIKGGRMEAGEESTPTAASTDVVQEINLVSPC